MKYEDFVIRIDEKSGDDYKVSIESPAGSGQSSLRLPYEPQEMAEMLGKLSDTFRGVGDVAAIEIEEVGSPGETTREMERDIDVPKGKPTEFGQKLFEHLLTGDARTLFNRSVGRVQSDDDVGLRIKLQLNTKDPDVAKLASLPWELIWSPEEHEYLNLIGKYPMVRHLAITQPDDKEPISLPLRILVVLANPKGVAELNLDHERKLIQENWATHESVEVDFLEKATIEELDRRLVQNEYHVLHYMGHGDFDAESGLGMLIMEGDNGEASPVRADTLSVVLRKARKMRLVVLNACDTGKAGKVAGQDPFAGVASALVMANVGDVVAMQFPISDKAAVKFAEKFYWSLATGFPVVAAVSEGRTAIKLARPNSMEWATPVLFMRSASDPFFTPVADGNSGTRDTSAVADDRKAMPPATPADPSGAVDRTPSKNRRLLMLGIPAAILVIAGAAWLMNLFGSPPDLAAIQWQNAVSEINLDMATDAPGTTEIWLAANLIGCAEWGPTGCAVTPQSISGQGALNEYEVAWSLHNAADSSIVIARDDSVSETQHLVQLRASSFPGSNLLVGQVTNIDRKIDSISVRVNVKVTPTRVLEASNAADNVIALAAVDSLSDRALADKMDGVLDTYKYALDELDAAKRDAIHSTKASLNTLADDFDLLQTGTSGLSINEERKRLDAWLLSSRTVRPGGSPNVERINDMLATVVQKMTSDVILSDPAYHTGARQRAIETCQRVANGKCTSEVINSFPPGTINYSLQYINASSRSRRLTVRLIDDSDTEVLSSSPSAMASARRTVPGHLHGGMSVSQPGTYTLKVFNPSDDLLGTQQITIESSTE